MKAVRALLGVALLALSGCHVGLDAFEPAAPRRAQVQGAEITVRQIVYRREFEGGRNTLLMEAKLPTGSGIEAAAIDSPHTPPCSAPGRPVRWLTHRVTPGGLSGLFDVRLHSEPEGPRVLDVELSHMSAGGASRSCVRIPLTGADLPWRRVGGSDFALQAGLRFEVVAAERSLSSVFVVPIGVVHHQGRLRLGAWTGIASGSCREELCGRDDEDLLRSGPVLPFELNADYLFGSSPSRWGLSARYGLRVAWTPEAPGERRHVIHAPHAALLWLLTRRERPAGWPTRAASRAFGFELPVGVWHDATSDHTGWFAGLGVTTAWPMF